jgi:iron complex outermembrane recepter protein
MNLNSGRKLRASLAFVSGAVLAAYAVAQDASSTTAAQPEVKMEKFVVTGSYIPMSSVAPAIPVSTFNTQDIIGTGETTNLLDVLTKISPVFSGGLNLGPTNGNIASNSTNGGSQATIRNLPTLVLVNGHRVAFSPVDSVGGYQFVDLNLIPVSAVEKVEILTDGASAIYGSDAVGGVVNIILKSSFNGWETGASYRFAPDLVKGHWGEREAYLTGGVSDGKNSIMVTAAWSKSDPLYQAQVSTSQFTTGTTNYPGVINIGSNYYKLSPTLTAPPYATPQPIATLVANGTYSGPYTSGQIISAFNLSNVPTSVISNERKSFVANLDHKITDTLTFESDVIYSQTNTFSDLNAQPISAKILAGAPFNPVNATVTAHDRFVTYPREFLVDTSSIQGVGTLKGNIGSDWFWKIDADYNQQHQNYQNPNLVEASALAADEAASSLNLFATSLPASTIANSGIFGTAFGEYTTSIVTFDAIANGKLFTLPAGDIQLAYGAECRREGLSATADINSLPNSFNWSSGTAISPLTVSRNIWGEFGQIVIPITSKSQGIPGLYSLSLDGAVRHEEYAGVSKKPIDPLVALRWQPLDEQLTIRGSYTQSFIAPTLFQLYGPDTIGFTPDITNFVASPTVGGGVTANDGQANVQTASNAALKPSTAENFTMGLVYSPKFVKGLSITTDYFRIRQTDIVLTPDIRTALQDIELKGTASQYAKFAALDDFPGTSDSTPITKAGQISGDPSNVYYNTAENNSSSLKYEAVDFGIDYTIPTSFGVFQVGTKETYNLHYWYLPNFYSSSGVPEQDAGKTSFYNGTIPRWRAYTTVSYTLRGWKAAIGNTAIAALTDSDSGEHVDPYYSWDASVSYTFDGTESGVLGQLKGLRVNVGVNNVLNRQPSHDLDVFSTDNADISTYSPLGRVVYTEVSYKF